MAYFQVVDAAASVVQVRDWYSASQLVAQTTLRSIVGRHELDQLLSERDRIDAELQVALDGQTVAVGVKVHRVEVRDVGLPRPDAAGDGRQAEAERERRAKVIAADGELQASEKLAQAAHVIAGAPGALQLRQLQTMVEISAENNARSSSRSRSPDSSSSKRRSLRELSPGAERRPRERAGQAPRRRGRQRQPQRRPQIGPRRSGERVQRGELGWSV